MGVGDNERFESGTLGMADADMTVSTTGRSLEVPTVGQLSVKSPVETYIANLLLDLSSWIFMCLAEPWLAINSCLIGLGDSSSSNIDLPSSNSTIPVPYSSRGSHKLFVSISCIGVTITASGSGDPSESSIVSPLLIIERFCRHLRTAKIRPKTLNRKKAEAERLTPITVALEGWFAEVVDGKEGFAIMFSLSPSSNLLWNTEKLLYS